MQPLAPPSFNPGVIVDDVDGTLHRDVIVNGHGLVVLLPPWPNYADVPGAVDTVQLEWAQGGAPGEDDYELADLQAFEGPMNGDSFPKLLKVPAEMLTPDGPARLRYRVITAQGSIGVCEPFALICDTTPPGGTVPPPAPIVPEEPITDAYLVNHPAGVAITLPEIAGLQPSDEVLFWWTQGPLEDPASLPPLTAPAGTPPVTVHVPPDAVNSAGDGGCYITYLLRDKATNSGRLSTPQRVAVALGPLPRDLLPPAVPLADDGLLDLADASTGIRVVIQPFADAKPSDRLLIDWGGKQMAEMLLGEVPGFPLSVPVPDTVLREAYGSATGPVATEVRYRVLRGDVPFTSPTLTISVDFYTPGPELPDWPDPVNPQLVPPRVFGTISNLLNVLTRDDEEQPAALLLQLYEPLHAGEMIDVYWNDTLVPEAGYTVGPDDQPGIVVTRFIPWDAIVAAGNQPALPVYYRLRAQGSPNYQQSPTAQVHADAYTLRPPEPEFLNVIDSPYGPALACSSLDGPDHAVLLQVPDLSEWLSDGDKVTVVWTPVARLEGEEILTGAIKEEEITLGEPGFPVTGFVWRVQPYAAHILPIHDVDPDGDGKTGRARGHYTFLLDGELIRSHQQQRVVGMYTAEGPCHITFNT